jgi:hypothetical protein
MGRVIGVLTLAAPAACKGRYLCASAFMAAAMLVISASPAGAQGYYGPYDYCVWSPYACSDYSSLTWAQGYLTLLMVLTVPIMVRMTTASGLLTLANTTKLLRAKRAQQPVQLVGNSFSENLY